ncbi:hypothetical protein CEXT_42421 [Caerostris extrusa]|uniref:Uncharacterized protein n=1 Tax=Caerostris extrusa TaxID=172846 RepID=A0AAV4MAD2_CAEEX|nr:hypothetical protein CEXT_42421 [Caerostris extrusa]
MGFPWLSHGPSDGHGCRLFSQRWHVGHQTQYDGLYGQFTYEQQHGAVTTPQSYQSDVPDDRARGPLLFTVNKDGSTVKLQDSGQMSSNANSMQQPQYYDPVLGQMMPQPIKKKGQALWQQKTNPSPPGRSVNPGVAARRRCSSAPKDHLLPSSRNASLTVPTSTSWA